MKIKSRKQRLREYNEKYPDRSLDLESHLRQYFMDRHWDIEKASKKAKKKIETILEKREYERVHMIFFEYPMKTDRPRTFLGHTYSPNAAENHKYFEKAIQQTVKTFYLINTPATITIDAYLEMPTTVKPEEVILFESKVLDIIDTPDYDNIGKCYTDMLKNILISDDDLFHIGTVRKFYSVMPRVEVTIEYIKSHESDYIYKKIKSRKAVKESIRKGALILRKLEYES